VDNEFLLNVSITQFNENFEILRIIQSYKVDISKYKWKLYEPTILINGEENKEIEITLKSNFDLKKINSLFSNLSSLTLIDLFDLRKSYKNLNYSLTDIDSHLYKIASYPLYLTLITILSAIIMFNIGYQKNSFFKITFGILLSVIIYYVNYFLNVLGTNEKIPLILSIFMSLIILSIINFISIIKINEK
ncbi:LptF/LptG family permease, partial [Candidatus Pelagibacter sp.]|nr:LptF/LptG family permease [Candidatus Pelagibacter sp.]